MNDINTKTAAYLLGMPVRTLNHHVKFDGAPKEGYDRYDPARLIQWYAGHCRRLVEEARSGASEKEARRRITVAKARIAEMQAEEKAGTLVPVESVHEEWAKVATNVRSKFLMLPSTVASSVMACQTPTDAQILIDTHVRQILTELSTYEYKGEEKQEVARGKKPKTKKTER